MISAYRAFTSFKLINNELWRLVTLSLTVQVLRLLFQIASSCFVSLSIHCSCHTKTSFANAPYSMTEMHILKDKTVNLAYRMHF